MTSIVHHKFDPGQQALIAEIAARHAAARAAINARFAPQLAAIAGARRVAAKVRAKHAALGAHKQRRAYA